MLRQSFHPLVIFLAIENRMKHNRSSALREEALIICRAEALVILKEFTVVEGIAIFIDVGDAKPGMVRGRRDEYLVVRP